MPAHMRVLVKPPKGAAKADRRKRRRAIETAETRAKRQAKARDGHCRVPGCSYPQVLEAMHISHAGMGGDPTLLRGGKASDYVTGCERHHKRMHAGYLRMFAEDSGGDSTVWFQSRPSLHKPWESLGWTEPRSKR